MKPNSIFPGILLFVHLSASAQTLNYQGIARNAEGEPLANRTLALRLSIKDTPDNGDMLYTETKSVATNGFGLYTIAINDGNGTRTGNFAEIDWSQQRFIQTEIDPDNGTAFTDLGTAPLHSVPQALNALQAATLKGIPEPKEGYFVEFADGRWIQKPKPKKYYASGAGFDLSSTPGFVGATVTIPIEEDNPIITVWATKAFGSTKDGGGDGLTVNLGYRKNLSGEPLNLLNDAIGIPNLRVAKGTRMPVTLSGILRSNFKKGESFQIGMIAYSLVLSETWDDNGNGRIVVEVSY